MTEERLIARRTLDEYATFGDALENPESHRRRQHPRRRLLDNLELAERSDDHWHNGQTGGYTPTSLSEPRTPHGGHRPLRRLQPG
jgi:hypothetical protein